MYSKYKVLSGLIDRIIPKRLLSNYQVLARRRLEEATGKKGTNGNICINN